MVYLRIRKYCSCWSELPCHADTSGCLREKLTGTSNPNNDVMTFRKLLPARLKKANDSREANVTGSVTNQELRMNKREHTQKRHLWENF